MSFKIVTDGQHQNIIIEYQKVQILKMVTKLINNTMIYIRLRPPVHNNYNIKLYHSFSGEAINLKLLSNIYANIALLLIRRCLCGNTIMKTINKNIQLHANDNIQMRILLYHDAVYNSHLTKLFLVLATFGSSGPNLLSYISKAL